MSTAPDHVLRAKRDGLLSQIAAAEFAQRPQEARRLRFYLSEIEVELARRFARDMSMRQAQGGDKK